MKNMDIISKRIFVIAFSIAMVLASASLLVFSATRVSGQYQNPNQGYNPPPAAAGGDGRIGMAAVASGPKSFQIIVWDTQTGASRIYYFDSNSNSYQPTAKQLPQQPL